VAVKKHILALHLLLPTSGQHGLPALPVPQALRNIVCGIARCLCLLLVFKTCYAWGWQDKGSCAERLHCLLLLALYSETCSNPKFPAISLPY
jgi:hypothetical protein